MKKAITLILCGLALICKSQIASNSSLTTAVAEINKVSAAFRADTIQRNKWQVAIKKTVDSLVLVAKGIPQIKKTADSLATVLNSAPRFDTSQYTVVKGIASFRRSPSLDSFITVYRNYIVTADQRNTTILDKIGDNDFDISLINTTLSFQKLDISDQKAIIDRILKALNLINLSNLK